jgi:hypothetical protein
VRKEDGYYLKGKKNRGRERKLLNAEVSFLEAIKRLIKRLY